MNRIERLEQQEIYLVQLLKTADDRLLQLNQNYIIETRPEEKIRLKQLISEAKLLRDDIDQQLNQVERELEELKRQPISPPQSPGGKGNSDIELRPPLPVVNRRPLETDNFRNRGQEKARLYEYLATDKVNLISLIGPGGR